VLKFEQKINNDRAEQKGYNQCPVDATAGGEAGRSIAAGMSQQKRAVIAALSC